LLVLHAFVVGWVLSTVVLALLLLLVVVGQRLRSALTRVGSTSAADPAPAEARTMPDYATAS
jgi:hypothetical protein